MSGSAADIRISFSWIDRYARRWRMEMVRLICTPSREGGREVPFLRGKKQREIDQGAGRSLIHSGSGKKEECASHGEHNPQRGERIGNRHVESDRSPAAASDAKATASLGAPPLREQLASPSTAHPAAWTFPGRLCVV